MMKMTTPALTPHVKWNQKRTLRIRDLPNLRFGLNFARAKIVLFPEDET
jgi:hypothetical protein